MPEVQKKPNVIIFGGLNTCSRALAAFLAPIRGEPLISHLRVVDKFSVAPPTTYIGSEFVKVLERPEVEYKQANLTVQSTVASSFDPPKDIAPYDYVFDFTGEVRHDRTELIQINSTCHIARLIGLEASKRGVKSYIRVQQPFYDTSNSTKAYHNEGEDIKPIETIGTWWHETLRMLAAIPDLNLVILRIGFAYGPFTNFGLVASAITVGSVYGYMKKPFKSLWSPGKNSTNTIHVDDVAGASWACAEWMASLGRAEANACAGEEVFFHNDKKKVKDVAGMPPPEKKIVAPLFNLVDDSQTTHLRMGQTISSFFGTTLEFFSFVEETFLMLMDDSLEDINEHHVGGWTEMIRNSDPQIHRTPLSAYMDKFELSKHFVAFSNSKIKQIVGYHLRQPHFDHDTIGEIVDKWKQEGSWPILN